MSNGQGLSQGGATALSAGIGAVGMISGGLISGITGGRRERAARRWNKKMWHKQNAYNHPREQMRRLKEAGLNPNLIYGSGSTQTGMAGAVAPGKSPGPVEIKTGMALQNALLAAQVKKIGAETQESRSRDWVNQTRQQNMLTEGRILERKYDILNNTWKEQAYIIKNDKRLKDLEVYVKTHTKEQSIRKAQLEVKKLIKTNYGQDLINKINAYEVQLNKWGLTKTGAGPTAIGAGLLAATLRRGKSIAVKQGAKQTSKIPKSQVAKNVNKKKIKQNIYKEYKAMQRRVAQGNRRYNAYKRSLK